jgi:hypothetical protein
LYASRIRAAETVRSVESSTTGETHIRPTLSLSNIESVCAAATVSCSVGSVQCWWTSALSAVLGLILVAVTN